MATKQPIPPESPSAAWRVKMPALPVYGMTGGPGADDIHCMRDRKTIVVLDDGSEHELPKGSNLVQMRPRLCGDFYCLIGGGKPVAATGDSRDGAFLNALVAARKAAA